MESLMKSNAIKYLFLRLIFVGLLFAPLRSNAQTYKEIPFGDMEHFLVHQVDESAIIGGKTKFLYEIAPGDTLKDNTPFVPNLKVSPWATSSVLAVVKGVTKGSCTVFPEHHGKGKAARLETRIERVKVLGLINISVLATGTIFLGEIIEPVRDTKDPMAKLMMGIPFTERPDALVFDYKFDQGQNGGRRMKMSGFSRVQDIEGVNCAEICVLLQKRWEDADGNVYAKRIGTAWEQYSTSTSGWKDGYEMKIHYGNIENDSYFKDFMALMDGREGSYFCRNSKGKAVLIKEIGWADPGEKPTHIIVRFSSGHGGAYVGAPGAMLHIDNVKLKY